MIFPSFMGQCRGRSLDDKAMKTTMLLTTMTTTFIALGQMTGGTPEPAQQTDAASAGPWSRQRGPAPPRSRGPSGGPWG